ncbi:Protein disulfide isomerase [Monocercomonoides exilis]|uniref:Protein disulfide isomerase n=1 Tax=Monocercomonoides exilis TaxID=2049356 RepID=UPI00355A0F85|nr:Protein disulfide isomerase [Monocercomonoides exilis]|eukprot:MONOS_8934.1-p1 / transcript=MONOS_8934.1 / gene=MONOS_8934 / organism=Monocercomonoides_exilis_PA203 / gene_product=Protein disulfide isomerase / transcript_product=Protein disulfide isomerase / location=Mono_scaffold00352:6327-8001(+) / protein_length=537 / sequence_SO=supercontig / SO=protein_coding / is_pseudo=false
MHTFTILLINLFSCELLRLTSENFTSTIETKPTFVMFFQQWCSFSTKLFPELLEAEQQMKDENIAFASVDCGQSPDLCFQYVKNGYPTVFLFQKDSKVLYEGDRNASAIQNWVKLNLEPPFTVVKNIKDAEPIIKKHEYAMVGSFAAETTPEFLAFKEACVKTQTRAVRIAIVDQSIKHPSIKMIHVQNSYEESNPNQKFSPEAISHFERSRSTPLVVELNPLNGYELTHSHVPVGYFFYDPSDAKTDAYKDSLNEIAKTHREEMLFAFVNSRAFGRMAPPLGLSSNEYPSFAIEKEVKPEEGGSIGSKAHYAAQETGPQLTMEKMKHFINNFLARSLKPTIRSQPIPKWQHSSVVQLVGNTFEKVVMDPTKDVFVRLVTPWCMKCNRTSPLFRRVAEDLDEIKKGTTESSYPRAVDAASRVVLAEMDVSENDVPPSIVVENHPFLLLFPASDKKHPIQCTEWYSYEKMKRFLSNTLKDYEPWKSGLKFPLQINEDAIADEDSIYQFGINEASWRNPHPANNASASKAGETNKTDL